jgi:hypothetical protein
MSKKEKLWHQRMVAALNSRQLVASCLFNQENPVEDEHDEYENERRAEQEREAIRSTQLGGENGSASLELGRALDLHDALRARLAAAGTQPLDIVDAVALEYLGQVLGCSPIAERTVAIAAKFESGTITFQGRFEALRHRLKLGVSIPDTWGLSLPHNLSMQGVTFENIVFERTSPGDTDLQTARVSGEVRFTFVAFESDAETDVAHLLEHTRVAIDPAQAPAPVQRVGLKDPRILHQALR